MALLKAWKKSGEQGNAPPIPLILNGWVGSDDFDKQLRWLDTIEWAEQHALSHLIPELADEDKYWVAEFSSYDYMTPEYGEQVHEPKPKPAAEDIAVLLNRLKSGWMDIVGKDLGSRTFPMEFSGSKKRKLTVCADPAYAPPWGSWNSLSRRADCHAFTRFRKLINEAIAPHAVDHVVFNLNKWPQRG